MSKNEMSLKALQDTSQLCLQFYMSANGTDAISKSYDANATEAEREAVMDLFEEIQYLQSGVYDPGPFIVMDLSRKAETDDQLKELARKQIKFTDMFAAIVGRTVPQGDLAAHMPEAAKKKDFETLQAPALAGLGR